MRQILLAALTRIAIGSFVITAVFGGALVAQVTEPEPFQPRTQLFTAQRIQEDAK